MFNSKLLKYSQESDLMNISITYGDELFDFNLYAEVVVN